ncbi:MAG: hypothetical protein ACREJM_09655, partial [Candidatus Saccharimonadales bacterium]
SSGGLLIGGDTQLYRSAADYLSLANGDSFRAYSSGGSQFLTLQSASTSVYLDARNSAGSDWALVSRVTSDTQQRYILKTDGTMQWGSGSATPDVQLSRVGVGSLSLQSFTNSSTAFEIQNSSNTPLLAFDNSAGGRLVIGGTGTSSEKLELYRGDTTTADRINFTTHVGTDWTVGQATGSNDFTFWQDATGSTVFTMSGSGANAGATTFQNGADSTSGFQILDHSNNHVVTVDTSHDTVGIGTTAATSTELYVWSGSSNSGQIINQASASSAALLELQHNGTDVLSVGSTGLLTGTGGATISGSTINLNASSNNVTNINTGSSTGAVNIGNTAAGKIQLQSGTSVDIGTTGTATSLNVHGTTLVQATSATAFQIQNAAGSATFLTVNTSSNTITVGSASNVVTLSSPGAGSNSEHFGASSSVGSNSNALAVGKAASVGSSDGTAIGYGTYAGLQ